MLTIMHPMSQNLRVQTTFLKLHSPRLQHWTKSPMNKKHPKSKYESKFFSSPFVSLPESESSVRDGPMFFCIKHPFQYQSGFEVDVDLIKEFTDWVYKNTTSRKGRQVFHFSCLKIYSEHLFYQIDIILQYIKSLLRKSAFTIAHDKMEYEMDFDVLRVNKKDQFHRIVHTGRPWEDQVCFFKKKKLIEQL